MLYHDNIIRNLPFYCPPGLQVTLKRVGRTKGQFRIKGADRSFLLTSNRPDIFTFESNDTQMKRFFADAYQRYANS